MARALPRIDLTSRLEEIEAALSRHPDVRECAVLPTDSALDDKQLTAFIISEEFISTLSLRAHLRGILPDYLIPSQFVFLDKLPRTPNGNTNRNALLHSGEPASSNTPKFAEPITETEKEIADIWRKVLGVEKVGRNDTFFDLGGHSLLAVKALAEMEDRLGVTIPLREIFVRNLRQVGVMCDSPSDDETIAGSE